MKRVNMFADATQLVNTSNLKHIDHNRYACKFNSITLTLQYAIKYLATPKLIGDREMTNPFITSIFSCLFDSLRQLSSTNAVQL